MSSSEQAQVRLRQPLSPEQQEVLRRRRHEARASATYRQFLNDLKAKGFRSDAEAEQAATAVLCALEQRLTINEAGKLESQLPSKLRDLVLRCERHEALLPRHIHLPEFLRIVKEHFSTSDMDEATAVNAVFETLSEHVTPGEIRKLIQQLPGDMLELWPEWARSRSEGTHN